MNYHKLYRRFIYSHYFSEGLRISAGVLLPALICGYFGYLQKGIFISLGALCVSLVDSPGPIHHRRNSLFIACAVIVGMAFFIGFALQLHWLFLLVLPVSCFLFSMIAVYGARATSIGIAALLIMVMMTHQSLAPDEILLFAALLLSGGAWYTLLSLVLYELQPYKLIQQVLGEYVLAAAGYLRARSKFYLPNPKEGEAYQGLMESQVDVQRKQEMVAELLFKTRDLVKESNHTGRVLMMAYLDVSDLLERAMTAHFDYTRLHEYFDETGILEEYHDIIMALARELEEIGIALISRHSSSVSETLGSELKNERERLRELRLKSLKPGNLDGFISLRHILDSIDDIAKRIYTLHSYTNYETALTGKPVAQQGDQLTLMKQDYSAQVFLDNLTWHSNIFRHSIRVTAAAMVAYVGGMFWSFGHNYWILLTVIFILKPGFGLTKTRNKQRIIGTLIGTTAAGVLLYFVKNHYVILGMLTLCMIIGYSFMRWKYLLSVSFLTAYLLLMFHLLEPQFFSTIMRDRVIDTFIGCGIAFLATLLIPSVWEKMQITTLLKESIEKARWYFESVAPVFTGSTFDKLRNSQQRKAAWVALANLSDAFNRMLSEPKNQQLHGPDWHRIVVSSHMIVSHTATLSSYAPLLSKEFVSGDYSPIIMTIEERLRKIEDLMMKREVAPAAQPNASDQLPARLKSLMALRQEELQKGQLETSHKSFLSTFKTITDQFYFIQNAAGDIEKISSRVADGQ